MEFAICWLISFAQSLIADQKKMKFYISLYYKLRTYNSNISKESYLPLFQNINEDSEIFFLTQVFHQKSPSLIHFLM